ncbi:MAG TPA: SDR family oxidoreductase [Candidatus Binatia bacterium]
MKLESTLSPRRYKHWHRFRRECRGGANQSGGRGALENIAQAALFLASPMAPFVTGQTSVMNGGSIGQS